MKILGSSVLRGETSEEREKNDFYATEPWGVELFLSCHEMNQNLWEPACGQGHISEVLLKHGKIVKSTDLIDRGYGNRLDFLIATEKWDGDIITNPPFRHAESFIEKGLSLLQEGNQLMLFLKIQFLETKSRYDLFNKYPLKYVYVHSSRIGTAKDADFDKYHAKAMCYAWFVWEKGFAGDTILRWIPGNIKDKNQLSLFEI